MEQDQTPQGVTYCHILTDQHQVLVASGLPCESLHVGKHLRSTIGEGRFSEVQRLIAQLRVSTVSTHPILDNKQSKQLVFRTMKNSAPLFDKTLTASIADLEATSLNNCRPLAA